MSVACPCTCLQYSRWRLNILSKLCASPEAQRAPALSFLHPRNVWQSPGHGRNYSSQRPPPESPYDGFDSLIKSDEEPTPDNDPLEPQKPENARPGRPRKKFDPYSPRGRQNVKDVIKALEDLAGRDDVPKQPIVVDPTTGKPWEHEPLRRPELPELPQSPIFKKQRKRDIPPKQLRSPAEQPLSHDPWARMLAEPIRQCRGSGVRLPISLLSNWSLTKHPTNGEVFLMPSQLADLDSMERVSRRQELRLRKRMRLLGSEDKYAPVEENEPLDDLANDADRADYAVTIVSEEEPGEVEPDLALYQPLPTTQPRPGSTPAVRILPYDNLINLFSLTTLRHSSRRANTTVRLLPRLWHDRFEQARHYERNREAFEKLTGEKDPSPPTIEATLDLNKLQWQTDIGERLLDILRKRVIVAVGRAAILYAQDKKRKLRHVSAISMAKVKGLLHSNQSYSLDLNDQNDTPSHGLISDDTNSTYDPVESDVLSPEVPITQVRELAVDHALTPRFFLYLGALNSPGLEEMTNPERQPMIPPLLHSPSRGRSQRFPVFPIRAMLGEEYYASMLELLETDQYLQPEDLNTLDAEGGDYLLMLKPSAKNPFIEGFLRAVWRLWRYGGGRRWMDPENDDYEGWKPILSEMHRLQARHAGKTDKDAVAEGIDELVLEVEEGAMEDQELEERAVEDGERALAKKDEQNKQATGVADGSSCELLED